MYHDMVKFMVVYLAFRKLHVFKYTISIRSDIFVHL